jgi:hypothetical protein
MTWCRSRITGLRIMLPALDPLPLERASLAELELAADLLSRLAGSARKEAQERPARLLDALVNAVRAAEHEARE